MTSIQRIAVYGRGLRARMLAASVAVICAVCLPGALWGQFTVNGNVWSSPAGVHVGIGLSNPGQALDVNGGIFVRDRGDGCCAEILMLPGGIETHLYATSDGRFYIYKNGAGSVNGAVVTVSANGSVGIGTTTTGQCGGSNTQPCLLTVKGAIGASEIVVTNGITADYVFDPDYRLAPLPEVAAYIQEHHHLPEIPSAAEVKEKGVSLGDMQAKLLAKIEELTLHLIHADEKNRELQERIARLEAGGR